MSDVNHIQEIEFKIGEGTFSEVIYNGRNMVTKKFKGNKKEEKRILIKNLKI